MHKFKGKKDEFLMFVEYDDEKTFSNMKLFARRQGGEWLMYTTDPSDPNFRVEEFQFRLVMVRRHHHISGG